MYISQNSQLGLRLLLFLGPHSENCWWRGKDTTFSWVLLPAPSFMGCVSLDKLLTLSGLQGLREKLRC